MAARQSYRRLMSEFSSLMSEDPLSLTALQDYGAKHELPGNSAGAVESLASRRSWLAKKISAATGSLNGTPQGKELQLASFVLKKGAGEPLVPVGGVPAYKSCPTDLQRLFSLTPIYMREEEAGASPEEVSCACASRNRKIGEYLGNAILRTEKPSWIFAGNEMRAAYGFKGYADAWRGFARKSGKVGSKCMAGLDSSLDYAESEVKKYATAIGRMAKGYTTSVGYGPAGELLKLSGIGHSPEEIREMSVSQMKSVTAEMDALRERIAMKYNLSGASAYDVARVLKNMDVFRPPKEELPGMAGEMAGRARAFLHGEIGLPEAGSDGFEVVPTPPYIVDVTSTAVLPPGPFAKGPLKSTCYVTQSEEARSELNRLVSPTTYGHEYVHHYQSMRSWKDKPVSLAKAWAKPMETSEGLAVLIGEKLMPAMGFSGGEKYALEEEYIVKADLMRLGARACAVLCLLTGDDGFLPFSELGVEGRGVTPVQKAASFHSAVTGWAAENSEADVTGLYSDADYGMTYAVSYLFGTQTLEKMASGALKNGYGAREFLDAVFSEGNVPLFMIGQSLAQKGMLGSAYV